MQEIIDDLIQRITILECFHTLQAELNQQFEDILKKLENKAEITKTAHNKLVKHTHKNIAELWKSINGINKRKQEENRWRNY